LADDSLTQVRLPQILDMVFEHVASESVRLANEAIPLASLLCVKLSPPPEDSQSVDVDSSLPIPSQTFARAPAFWRVIEKRLAVINRLFESRDGHILEFLEKYPQLLSLRARIRMFRQVQVRKLTNDIFPLNVSRDGILTQSFRRLSPLSSRDFLRRIQVSFYGEPGLDAGGVMIDWMTNLTNAIFNPNHALFIPTANGRASQPNPTSWSVPDHLGLFRFAGRVIARAVIEGIAVDAHLSRSLLKHLLGQKMSLRDLEDIDQEQHDSLLYLLENDAEDCGLTFCVESDDFGHRRTIPLVADGANIPVTNENRQQYVVLMVEHRLTGQVAVQIQNFVSGFYELIPRQELAKFQADELDLLICGVPEIDVDDLRVNSQFIRPYSNAHPVVARLFEVLREFDEEQRAKFLMFLTGSSQVPFGGFRALVEMGKPITIAPGGEGRRLPQAHTCMNQLDLPGYESKRAMREKLLLAIQNCNSFGFQ
jgi:E3 ubiquitin-protein ligase HUWE1